MVKKSKTAVVDFTVDHSAASLAESWLDGMVKRDSGDQTADTVLPDEEAMQQPRPARMGLGAKFVPHSKLQSGKAVSECLDKNKKRSVPDVIFRAKALADSDDENESRTKTIKKSKITVSKPEMTKKQICEEAKGKIEHDVYSENEKKKKKKKKEVSPVEVEVEVELDNAGPGKEVKTESKDTGLVNTTNISAARAEELACRPPRRRRIKGKKTRSKQKNIRRDNRPEHLKPGFQNPPSL
jgi:hypothetical protein